MASLLTLPNRVPDAVQREAVRCRAGTQLKGGPRVCGAALRAAPRPGQASIMILEALGQLVDVLRRPARHFHAEMQSHLGQYFLDLVQRLAPEVRGTQHL